MQRNPLIPQALPFKRLATATLLASTLLGLSAPAWSMDLLQAYEAARAQDATILASRATAAALEPVHDCGPDHQG